MKSVVIKRDFEGKPVWNHDYESFMKAIGFERVPYSTCKGNCSAGY